MRQLLSSDEPMSLASVFAVSAALIWASSSTTYPQADVVRGAGAISCARWLAEPGVDADVGQWILGYWTGLNAYAGPDHNVGRSTDNFGVVAAVRLECQRDPSRLISFATEVTHLVFAATHR